MSRWTRKCYWKLNSWIDFHYFGPFDCRALCITVANFPSNLQSFSHIRVSTQSRFYLVVLTSSSAPSHRIFRWCWTLRRWMFSLYDVQTKMMWSVSVGLSTISTYLPAQYLRHAPDTWTLGLWTTWMAFYCCFRSDSCSAWLNWSSLFCDWIHRNESHGETCVVWCNGRDAQLVFGSCADILPDSRHTVDTRLKIPF